MPHKKYIHQPISITQSAYLDLRGVVLPVVQQQVCKAPGLWGVLAHACSVRVHSLEGIRVPFPPVAEGMCVYFCLLFCLREGLRNLILPVCLKKK